MFIELVGYLCPLGWEVQMAEERMMLMARYGMVWYGMVWYDMI